MSCCTVYNPFLKDVKLTINRRVLEILKKWAGNIAFDIAIFSFFMLFSGGEKRGSESGNTKRIRD